MRFHCVRASSTRAPKNRRSETINKKLYLTSSRLEAAVRYLMLKNKNVNKRHFRLNTTSASWHFRVSPTTQQVKQIDKVAPHVCRQCNLYGKRFQKYIHPNQNNLAASRWDVCLCFTSNGSALALRRLHVVFVGSYLFSSLKFTGYNLLIWCTCVGPNLNNTNPSSSVITDSSLLYDNVIRWIRTF